MLIVAEKGDSEICAISVSSTCVKFQWGMCCVTGLKNNCTADKLCKMYNLIKL